MKKVSIFKNNKLFLSGNFEDNLELNSWIDKRIKDNTFGLPERPEMVLNQETGEMEPTGVILPAEYEVVIEDITAQVEQEKINAEALAYLASTDWLIIREIDAGVFCPLEIKQKRQEARAKIVK